MFAVPAAGLGGAGAPEQGHVAHGCVQRQSAHGSRPRSAQEGSTDLRSCSRWPRTCQCSQARLQGRAQRQVRVDPSRNRRQACALTFTAADARCDSADAPEQDWPYPVANILLGHAGDRPREALSSAVQAVGLGGAVAPERGCIAASSGDCARSRTRSPLRGTGPRGRNRRPRPRLRS